MCVTKNRTNKPIFRQAENRLKKEKIVKIGISNIPFESWVHYMIFVVEKFRKPHQIADLSSAIHSISEKLKKVIHF